jgi:chemotaxis protein MotB
MRKKKHVEEEGGGERWLITYADLITLLLAFFILMYTMSKQDNKKYQEVAAHLKPYSAGVTRYWRRVPLRGRYP